MSFDARKVRQVLETIPTRYRGPGGAAAVLKDGKLIGKHVWGYADMNHRIPMTDQVLFPICSITKQMLCLLMIDLEKNPTPAIKGKFQELMAIKLKELLRTEVTQDGKLKIDHLTDMCSGLRDYWASCTLWGSRPDTPYSIHRDNTTMLNQVKSFHFEPGTELSYCNTNFNILGRLIEAVTEESLTDLLAERVFKPAQMTTARLCPDCSQLPTPCVPYEGTEKTGFVPAYNFIEWAGDAGAVASITDMIAYEHYFDSKYSDTQDNYRDVVKPRRYKDNALSWYRYGLEYYKVNGITTTGHGGALRGFRLHRRYAVDQRVSVIVMFNHEASAQGAAGYVLSELLDIHLPSPKDIQPDSNWFGSFLDPETQLAIIVSPSEKKGEVNLSYSGEPEPLILTDAVSAKALDMEATINGDTLKVTRFADNRVLNAKRIAPPKPNHSSSDKVSIQGIYESSTIQSKLRIVSFSSGSNDDRAAIHYAHFTGFLGEGPPHLMTHLGENVWSLADPRGMDAPAPGDWTLVFKSDQQGQASTVTIGCWLARGVQYERSREA